MPEPSLQEKMQELLASANETDIEDLYSISYDMEKGNDYSKIVDGLEDYAAKRVLESHWLLKRENASAFELYNHFLDLIAGNDRLVIIAVSSIYAFRPLTDLDAFK